VAAPLLPLFGVTRDRLDQKIQALTESYCRFPHRPWEPSGYVRTTEDALRYEVWDAVQRLTGVAELLRPRDDDEITVGVFIADFEGQLPSLLKIEKEILCAVPHRAWASLVEPHADGRPHRNLIKRINRNQLDKLKVKIREINCRAGFRLCKLSRPSDITNWSRPGKLPGLVGYCGKNAPYKDNIVSFMAWLDQAGCRWIRTSSRLKAGLTPSCYIPPFQHPENIIESAEGKTASPSRQPLCEARQASEDDTAKLEHQGRDLNDKLSDEKRATAFAIVQKALESARSVMNERKRRSLWARLRGVLTSIRRYSSDPTVKAIALHISSICKADDATEMARFGLKSNASLIFDPAEISRLEKATKEAIQRWSGEQEGLERIERVLLQALANHDHTLKFAAVSAAVGRYVRARNLKPGMTLYDQLKKQLGHHFKSTGNGRWFKRDLLSVSDEAIVERLRGTDLRTFRTRAKHGLEPDQTGLVTGSTETKSRKRTKDERALEIQSASELSSIREKMALHGRFGKFNPREAREQARQPIQGIDMVKILKKSIQRGIGINEIMQWAEQKIGKEGADLVLAHVLKAA
jgi:hypothetical protein